MSAAQPADEVAEDYKASLEYLTNNDRYAINNFTVIAKENTEHADAISNVLVTHIGKVRPDHKLPALYVLDSIAKNIGTPYTLFLGHKLYTTFMDAYSKVDRPTRKKLDEMLKTWKSPVPGSIDSRPVFPIEITKKIENALIQVKTRAIQFEQQQQKAQQELLGRRAPGTGTTTQWHNTPTPPQNTSVYPPPMSQGYALQATAAVPQANSNASLNRYAQLSTPPPHIQYQHPQQHFNALPPQHLSSVNLDILHRDLEELIRLNQEEFSRNLWDAPLQTKLKALLDLQTVLRKQQLPHHQIQAIRDQVNALQANQKQATSPPLPLPISTPIQAPMNPSTPILHYGTPSQIPYQPPPSQQDSPASNLLASLLASVERNKQNQAESNFMRPAQVPTPQSVPPPPPPSAIGENPLLAKLRASGLLGASGGAPPSGLKAGFPTSLPHIPPVSQTPANSAPSLNLSDLLKRTSAPQVPAGLNTINRRDDIELTSQSLKLPRLHLISKLYEARPNQCLTCGKRFMATDDGRAQKARHLDWHFRTNQRLVDSAQRGQSRSWYVDELEWIRYKENEDEGLEGTAGDGKDARTLAANAALRNDPKNKFILVPSDSDLEKKPCAICQENFAMSWKEELQDFVWMDAVKIGERVYHASCYADFKKDEGSTPVRIATPDSVLGKRKAEASNNNPSPVKSRRGSSG